MKIKINSMLSGGVIPPFSYFKPVIVPTADVSGTVSFSDTDSILGKKSSSNSDEENAFGDKAIIDLLKLVDGLPSDMEMITKLLSSLYRMNDISSKIGINTSNLAQLYFRILQMVKNASTYKKSYDEAYKQLEKNDGLDAPAIAADGRVIVKNSEGNIEMIAPELLVEQKDKYSVLTNSNLLHNRANKEQYAYDNSLVEFAETGYGLRKVDEYIDDFLANLGTDSSNVSSYEKRISNLIAEGIKTILDIADSPEVTESGVDGLYKITKITKELKALANHALQYIYKMLPEKAKTLLKLKSDGTSEGAINTILNLINSKVSSSHEFTELLVLDSEGKKLGSKSSTKKDSDGSDKMKLSVASLWYSGYGNKSNIVLNGGTTYAINAKVPIMPIVDKEGTSSGLCNMLQILQSQYGPMLDVLNASFGGNFIPDSSWQLVLVDGLIGRIDLPLDTEALQNGKIKPDLALSKKLEQLDQYIRDNNIDPHDFLKVNELCEQFKLPLKYNENGTIDYSNWASFAVMNATALGSAFRQDQTFNEYVSEVLDDNELKNYIRQFEKSLGYSDGKFKYDEPGMWDNMLGRPLNFLSTNDLMFKGTLYIPIRTNMFNALAGSGTEAKLTVDKALEIEALELQKEKIANYNNPGGFEL